MKFRNINLYRSRILTVVVLTGLVFFTYCLGLAKASGEVAITLGPSTGTFVVDSTFDLSVFVDTQDQSVNAIELTIHFPPDKMQLISSSTGKSVIGIWPTPPTFNNQTGIIQLVGGVPGGIKASRGLITTLTFRAKSVGSAVIHVDSSRVLFNDGSGTEALVKNNGGIYQVILPPPAGPSIVSDTHPIQGKWYRSNNVNLQWAHEEGVQEFSYMISELAVDIPDDISEGAKESVTYRNVSDGRHYFHIKGLRNGQWGGVSHFALNVDTTAPAEFKIVVIPSARTARIRPIVQFETTDALSGMDHYEMKWIDLQNNDQQNNQSFFIEAQSPYIPGSDLAYGKYDAIIRAYDAAGNVREVTQRVQIVPALFQNVADQGLVFKSTFVIPWWVVWIVSGILLIFVGWIGYIYRKRHVRIHQQLEQSTLTPELANQLEELQKFRDKYGKVMVLIFALSVMLLAGPKVYAKEPQVLNPPLITTVSKNISNDEIFYVGGKAGFNNAEVVILIANQQTGETLQKIVPTNENGEWFYQHDGFLNPGDYLLWGQTKLQGQVSPPSPQVKLTVEKKALQIGSVKLSYINIYILLIGLLILLILILFLYIYYHHRSAKLKQELHRKKLDSADASIRRGFAMLMRDIQEELAIIHSVKANKQLTDQEREREQMIMQDLQQIQQYLGDEIWELEKTDQ